MSLSQYYGKYNNKKQVMQYPKIRLYSIVGYRAGIIFWETPIPYKQTKLKRREKMSCNNGISNKVGLHKKYIYIFRKRSSRDFQSCRTN